MRLKSVLILAFMGAFPFMGNAQRKHAFLVGISNYKKNGYKVWHNIHGKEDVLLLTPILEKQGFKTTAVLNEQATHDGILHMLDQFIETVKKGDVVYLHFSCHGQPVEDGLNGFPKDEADGWDEAIVPIDAGKAYGENGYEGNLHITDDELKISIERLRERLGARGVLYVAMDACHAGTMSRKGVETVRGTNEGLTKTGIKYNPPKDNFQHYVLRENKKGLASVMFIEACKSRERNTEIRVKDDVTGKFKEYGSLSYNIYRALQGHTLGKNRQNFYTSIKAETEKSGQWPKTQTLVRELSGK